MTYRQHIDKALIGLELAGAAFLCAALTFFAGPWLPQFAVIFLGCVAIGGWLCAAVLVFYHVTAALIAAWRGNYDPPKGRIGSWQR